MLAFLILAAGLAPAQPPTIVLDPGHGGQDWGATVKGRREKDVVLAVAKRLKERLEKSGARVKLTREGDSYLPLDKRVGLAAEGPSLFVSLHANKVPSKNVRGVTVYAYGKDRIRRAVPQRPLHLPPLPAPPKDTIRAGRELASSFVRTLRSVGLRAEADRADYYVLKSPGAAVLIEMGYLSHPAEAALLEDAAYQERLAEAMAGALAAYLSPKPATSAGR